MRRLLVDLPGWTVESGALHRRFRFRNFAEAMAFANRIGDLAESEGHHPDLGVGWGYVSVDLITHAIGAPSENDFILATRIDALPR